MPAQSAFAPGISVPGEAAVQTQDGLRKLDWNELAARLNAARDLRVAMRDGVSATAEDDRSIALNAAESFEYGDDQRVINRDVLEARKASNAIRSKEEGYVARGDEETIYD